MLHRVAAPPAFAVACLALVCLSAVPALAAPSDAQVLQIAKDVRTSPGELPRLEITVDGKTAPLPLRHTQVFAELSTHVAQVTVTQTYRNDFERPIEARYVFPLPENSAVDDMQIQVGGRTIRAEIQRRAEARKTFEAARNAGHTAALLEQERPNIFTQSVTNIPPGEAIQVTVRFVQQLSYDKGEYEWVFPMVVGPRFMPGAPIPGGTDQVPDAARINPPIIGEGNRTGHDIDIEVVVDSALPIVDLQTPTHDVDAHTHDDGVMNVRLAESDTVPNRDFVLRYQVGGEAPQVAIQAHKGERHGHFALTVQPPQLDVDALVGQRELIFVVDVSGSMMGRPLNQAKAAARDAIRQLRPVDTFNLYTFAGRTGQAFKAPRPANETNIRAALDYLSGVRAGGGTMMGQAVDAALSPPVEDGRHRYVVFLTDGYIGNENAMFSKASGLVKSLKAKGQRARVFALGVGNSVNRHLITGLGEAGKGLGLVLTLDEREQEAVRRIYRLIDSPVLRDVVIDWGKVDVEDVYPTVLPDVLASRPLIVHGRFAQASEGVVTVRAKTMDGKPVRFTVPVTMPAKSTHGAAIASLWARARVEELSRALWSGHDQSAVDAITATGLEHRLVTAYTSFVAVDTSRVVDGEPVQIDQPVEAADGVDIAAATAHQSGLNAMMGSSVGNARGFGGLGISGVGRGGGGGAALIGGGALGRKGYGRGANRLGERKASIPRVIPGKPIVTGSLSKAIIRRVIRRHRNEYRYCYEKVLNKAPGLAGKVRVSFTIGADGKVIAAKTLDDTLKDPAVAKCLVRKVKRWVFPAPKGGGVVAVVYPFVFAPSKARLPAKR